MGVVTDWTPDAARMRADGIAHCAHVPVVDGMCYCVEHTRLECWCGAQFRAAIVDGKRDETAQRAAWKAHQLAARCGPWVVLAREEAT